MEPPDIPYILTQQASITHQPYHCTKETTWPRRCFQRGAQCVPQGLKRPGCVGFPPSSSSKRHLEAFRRHGVAQNHITSESSLNIVPKKGAGPFLYIHDTQYKARHQCASPWAKQHSKTTSIQGYHNGISNSQAISTNVGPWMGRWYAEGWISSKQRSPLGSTPRPAMKRSGTNTSSLLWYLAVYDVFSWNLVVPDICLICVISYHDTWHDILLSLISSLHIFVTVAHQQSFPWNMLKRTDTRMKRKRLLIQPLRSLGPIDQATPELTGWLTKKVWYCHNCHEIFGEIGL